MSLTQWTRIIHDDNGTLIDYTLAAQNNDAIPFEIINAEDYIYVGQHFPFNNFFMDVNTVNSNSASIEVETWDGNNWQSAVDILDETKLSGAPLARSGSIIFAPDRDLEWNDTEDTNDSDAPPQLSTLRIYNMFWMRFRFSADTSAGTILNKIGYRFATTTMLNSIDPDIDQYLSSWESGKTDWDEQLINASIQVIADLKAKGLIVHPGQILRMDEVSMATAYKALALIYVPLGPDLGFRLENANKKYKQLMDIKRFTIDQNRDGVEDTNEVVNTPMGVMVR